MISPSNTGPGLTRGGPLAEGVASRESSIPRAAATSSRVVAARGRAVHGPGDVREADRAEAGPDAVSERRDGEDRCTRTRSSGPLGGWASGRRVRSPTVRSRRATSSRGQDRPLAATGRFPGGRRVRHRGDRLLQALRARLGRRVTILVTDVFVPLPNVLDEVGSAARGLYVSTTDAPPAEGGITPAGRSFARGFGASVTPTGYVMPARRLRGRARRDRPIRRNPSVGTRAAAFHKGQERHPRRLPLRPRDIAPALSRFCA